MTYIIEYDKKACIGAGECEALSKLWKVDNKGKAILEGSQLNAETGMYELKISDDKFKEQDLVAGSCPVGCIKIRKV